MMHFMHNRRSFHGDSWFNAVRWKRQSASGQGMNHELTPQIFTFHAKEVYLSPLS